MTKTKPSKSARKREHLALQELGEQLIGLAPEQLSAIDMDDTLLGAVLDAQTIKSHGAMRRQKQLIGKLMRGTDAEPIREALEQFSRQGRLEKAVFRRAERWRDRLVNEGEPALQAYTAETGAIDNAVATLLDELYSTDRDAHKRRIRRQLFRTIHHQLTSGMQTGAD